MNDPIQFDVAVRSMQFDRFDAIRLVRYNSTSSMHNSNSMYFDQLDIVRLVRCSSTCSMYFDQFGAVRRVRCNSMRIDVYICNVQTRSTHNDISVQICHCGSIASVRYIYIHRSASNCTELVELHRTGRNTSNMSNCTEQVELYRAGRNTSNWNYASNQSNYIVPVELHRTGRTTSNGRPHRTRWGRSQSVTTVTFCLLIIHILSNRYRTQYGQHGPNITGHIGSIYINNIFNHTPACGCRIWGGGMK